MNPMRELRLEKVVINIGVGEGGDKLVKAEKVLKMISGQEPVRTYAKKTIREWGVKKGMPIGCKVTLRKKKAEEVLDKLLNAVERKISERSFDEAGNFSFGIKEHIDIPGIAYDPEIGIFGMDVCVSISRPGYRVKVRKKNPRKIGRHHQVTKEEAIDFMTKKFNVVIV
ncbi:MAG: 50S ribosomal protein L5 [Candidatus Hadarchaeales archaeon]